MISSESQKRNVERMGKRGQIYFPLNEERMGQIYICLLRRSGGLIERCENKSVPFLLVRMDKRYIQSWLAHRSRQLMT